MIPLASSQHNLYDIYLLLCVQYQTPDDGQKICQKHEEFYCKNKFEKLVHLFGFFVIIYHDAARSHECQINKFIPPWAMDSYTEWRRNSIHSQYQHYLEESGKPHAAVAMLWKKYPPVPIQLEDWWIPALVWTFTENRRALSSLRRIELHDVQLVAK